MPDYMFLLDSRISPDQREALLKVQQVAQAHEMNIYLAGGAIRDLITGMLIKDFDFVVEGSALRLEHDLQKAGARIIESSEKLRHIEFVMPGEVECSVASARDDVYAHPGAKPEIRWSTVTEDLRRRDFSINAVALSLNAASRGLMLDPTNGLSDLESNHEVRALSIHSFTNQPERMLRLTRLGVRMGFKIEQRTSDWFALAKERGLHENLDPAAVGREIRQLAREDKVVAILKAWENHTLIGSIHERLSKRHPDYDSLAKFSRVREGMMASGIRISSEGAFAPTVYYLLGKLGSREQSSAIHRMEFRKPEVEAIHTLEASAEKLVKILKSPPKHLLPKNLDKKQRTKAAEARALYDFLEKTPPGLLAFVQSEYSQPRALSVIRMYVSKWKPLRAELPALELETMGMPRGPKFDQVIEELFNLQLIGKARNPQDRTALLRKLSGIKPEPPKREKKEEKKGKPVKGAKGAESAPASAKPEVHPGKGKPGKTAAAKPAVTAPAVRPAAKAAKTKPAPKPSKPKTKGAKKSKKK
ncbi:MAG: CCA tRNA nucleotidyltransferase [Acidobacteria bacterium]|nr:CCA tRNA nucleotidyltransferase [Acidobacteriota bacterium]